MSVCFIYVPQLRRLLDVASAHEPARSEERAGVGEPVVSNPRQLGGVVVVVMRVATMVIVRVEGWRRMASQSCFDVVVSIGQSEEGEWKTTLVVVRGEAG